LHIFRPEAGTLGKHITRVSSLPVICHSRQDDP
jgi:hypothetical protein